MAQNGGTAGTAQPAQDLAGKVAIVTGGSRGIGREIALHLARRGASVAICYAGRKSDADETASLLPSGKSLVMQADISKVGDVKTLFESTINQFGKVDFLINNAGCAPPFTKIGTVAEEDIDKTINLNIKGAFYCLQEAARCLPEGGRIVNITTSLVAYTFSGSGTALYAGSKAALETFTKCMAPELKGRKITVNAVAPGPVATELFFAGKTEAQVQHFVDLNPLQRLGQPSDIASVVGFLVSKEGEWINGQIIRVNGGYV